MSEVGEMDVPLSLPFEFNEGWSNGAGVVVVHEEEAEKQVLRYAKDDTR